MSPGQPDAQARVVVVSGSPTPRSRTRAIADHVGAELTVRGWAVECLDVRELPAAELLGAQTDGPVIHAAIEAVERATGLVLVTPVYNAAYSGALKTLLDLLPRHALAGKVLLPIAIGGTLAHVLAIDYALRPVLASMGEPHVVGGLFLSDAWLPRTRAGDVLIEHEEARRRLDAGLEQLAAGLRRAPEDRQGRTGPSDRAASALGELAVVSASAVDRAANDSP